jgi:hypothetical protein
MLNLTPDITNNLIIYADTVSVGYTVGDYFLMVLTNSYSKQTFAVVPTVVRKNTRFVELEIELVASTAQNDELNGKIYLYDQGNWEYLVFNTSQPTLTATGALSCKVWNTDTDFWNFSTTIWNVCNIITKEIDRGQAFLYAPLPADREVEFVPYEGGNNILEAIVYVVGATGN